MEHLWWLLLTFYPCKPFLLEKIIKVNILSVTRTRIFKLTIVESVVDILVSSDVNFESKTARKKLSDSKPFPAKVFPYH